MASEEINKINKEFHYCSVICNDAKPEGKGKLEGIHFSLKDCFCVKDIESHASSAILKGYKPVFDSTVAERIKNNGGTIIAKTVQDEFGFGGFGLNVGNGFEIPLNPFDKTRVCGGSSAGAAGLTQKAEFRHVAIAESTGGSIVNPAAFCGVIGLCPTYGLISRYGVMDYASSMDKVGLMAKNMKDLALTLNIIAGKDEKDSTCMDRKIPDYTKSIEKNIKGLKIGIIKDNLKDVDPEIEKATKEVIAILKEKGANISEVSLPFTEKNALTSYYVIALCEASTNLARYCGMRYGAEEKLEGTFNEYFSKVRSNHFNEEAKRRILLGTFARMSGYRDAYYIKASKVRTKIIKEYKEIFKKVDVLLSPTMPILAPKISEIEKLTPLQNYKMDQLTVGPNLAGLPHITIPLGEELPPGIMFIGNHFDEEIIIQVGSKL